MATISENNVILKLTVKSDEYRKDLKAANKETQGLEKSVKSLGDSLNNDMKEKQIKVVNEELGKLGENVKSLTDTQKKQKAATDESNKSIGNSIKDFKLFGISINDIKDKFSSLKSSLKDTKEEVKSLKDTQKKQKAANDKLNKSIGDSTKDFKLFGVSIGDIRDKFSKLKGRLKDTQEGVKGVGSGWKKFNAILKLSIIGVILTTVVALVGVFSKFQPAIDLVEKSMASLNAVFNVVIGRAQSLFLGLGKILSGDFSKGFDEIKDSAKGLTTELKESAKAAFELQQRAIDLRGAERELSVEIARQRGEIEKNRIEADRETNDGIKGINRRKEAIKKAIDLEIDLEKRRVDAAAEAVRIQFDLTKRNGRQEADLEKLAELQVEYFDVIEDGNSKRAADLLTLQGLDKEAAQLSKERSEARQKELQAESEITKKVLQNIEDLQNALIGKSEARAEAQAKTAAKRTIDALIGSEEEIKKQTALINKLLKQELENIRFSTGDVPILESDFLTKQIESLTKTDSIKLDLKSVVTFEDKEGFGEKLGKLFDPESESNKKLREGLGALQDITSSIFAADDKATEAKLANIETQIDAADERIKRAIEGGKEGSEELIAIEEAKIDRLEAARQKSLEQQQRQAKIESALAATSALVNAVPLVIDLFKKGGLVGGLAGIASVIASIATLRAAVQKNTPTFHTGTSYADESGNGTGGRLKSSEFMAKLEKGEMVIPKGDSARLRGLGIKHTDILELAENAREGRLIGLNANSSDSKLVIETNNKIIEQNDRLLRYMKNLKTEVSIDERGLSIRQMRLQSKIKKRR